MLVERISLLCLYIGNLLLCHLSIFLPLLPIPFHILLFNGIFIDTNPERGQTRLPNVTSKTDQRSITSGTVVLFVGNNQKNLVYPSSTTKYACIPLMLFPLALRSKYAKSLADSLYLWNGSNLPFCLVFCWLRYTGHNFLSQTRSWLLTLVIE